MNAQSTAGYKLSISRYLATCRENVFDAWINPEALVQWFSPSDEFSVEVHDLDVQPGGRYRITMHEADGDRTVYGEYVEITEPECLVITWAWEHSEDESQMLVTVRFDDLGDKTRLNLLHENLPGESARDLHQEGWEGCLDRLARLNQA